VKTKVRAGCFFGTSCWGEDFSGKAEEKISKTEENLGRAENCLGWAGKKIG